jgi:hypothetical protein
MKRTEGAEQLEPSFGAGIATVRCLCRGSRGTHTASTVKSVNPSRLVVMRRAAALARRIDLWPTAYP